MSMHLSHSTLLGFARRMNAGIAIALALYFLVAPLVMCLYFLHDHRLREGRPSSAAYFLHAKLSPQYAAWARERVASGRAAALTTKDLIATEWPMFGTVFYLWATESLQQDWEKDPAHTGPAPRDTARDAIEAGAALIADPNHAGWVKKHWGADYLTRENVFYRMMLIGGLTSYQRLSGNAQYEPIIRAQVESLTSELDATTSGLVNDYPGECYPGDVMASVYAVQQADTLLHTDHRAFIDRMKRAFTGPRETKLGLPPFWADARTGAPIEPTRGSSNSYMCLTAPALWPEEARRWYGLHVKHFWQQNALLAGFREFPRDDVHLDLHAADMDSGPVALGYGFAATAFGTGAALANGDLNTGGQLLAEMLPGAWPLPNGTLLLPRILSDAGDAPLLGEACILYNMTRTPAPGAEITTSSGHWPGLVYLVLAMFGVPGVLGVIFGARTLMEKSPACTRYAAPRAQLIVWTVLLVSAVLAAPFNLKATLLLMLLAQFLPRIRRERKARPAEGVKDQALAEITVA